MAALLYVDEKDACLFNNNSGNNAQILANVKYLAYFLENYRRWSQINQMLLELIRL